MSLDLRADLFNSQLPSAAEMAEFDRVTIAAGTPALELMENAASAVHQVVSSQLRIEPGLEERVLVLCGPGNNGGDGLALARELYHEGTPVDVIIAGAKKYSADFHIQARKLAWAGMRPCIYGPAGAGGVDWEFETVDSARAAELAGNAALIVDALLGTGQNAAPRASLAELINIVNEHRSDALLVAVDTPSGVNVDTGEVYEPHLKAGLTVCIELIKRGLLQSPAREAAGEFLLAPIGIDCSGDSEFSLSRPDNLSFPAARAADFHKGQAGHVLVLGGSAAMPGAPALAAEAALRSGAGLVTMASLPRMHGLVRMSPEIMLLPLAGQEGACYAAADTALLEESLDKVSVLVIGPGLGCSMHTAQFLSRVLLSAASRNLPLVLDADALNLLSQQTELPLLSQAVLTPHPGEMGRLLGMSAAQVQKDRYGAARELARKTGALVVLKGAASIIHDGQHGWVNSSGNPSLATAGSGDVLSGIIAGLAAQSGRSRAALLEAARAGVYLHGLAGDLASRRGRRRIVASDIIRRVPYALARPQA